MKKIKILFTELGVAVLAINSVAQSVPPPRPGENIGQIIQPNQSLPPELAQLMMSFEAQRAAYLDAQRQLAKEMQGSTEQERAVVRERIRATRDGWLAEIKTLREDIRAHVEELKGKLPGRREIMESARPQPGTRPGVD
jgi:hypothetical protein